MGKLSGVDCCLPQKREPKWLLRDSRKDNRKGQSALEYVLLISIVAGLGSLLFIPLGNFLEKKLSGPILTQFQKVYKYGDSKTCGFDDPAPCSGPSRHPRIDAADNFRIFGRGRK